MNVEELLQSKDIVYRPSGGDLVIRCLSPDHEDKNPSLRIDKISGIFNCLSCGFKGNIFTHFGEKVGGIQLKKEMFKEKLRAKLSESIGLSYPKDMIPYEGDWRGISAETYLQFKAFTCHQPEYVGRIMFPIYDITGRVCAFQGRHTAGGTPKYLNSPAKAKLPLFPDVKPYRGSVILVEGLFDMLNLHDKGITNAVCCFGVNQVTEDKLAVLKLKGITKVYIFFDGDTAGQNGAEKLKELCERMDLVVVNIYVQDKDPGQLNQTQVYKLKRKIYENSNY